MSRYVALCHVISRHVTSCQVMPRDVPHVTSWHVMSCHVISRNVTSCHVMSRHVTSCPVMSRHVISWYVISRRKSRDGHATNTSLSTDFFHTQSIRIKHDRVRWLSRRLPIQYRISGIWSSFFIIGSLAYQRADYVLRRFIYFLSAALRSNAADYVLRRFIFFYFFLFFYSPFVLRNYSTDSHKIFRNCVF